MKASIFLKSSREWLAEAHRERENAFRAIASGDKGAVTVHKARHIEYVRRAKETLTTALVLK